MVFYIMLFFQSSTRGLRMLWTLINHEYSILMYVELQGVVMVCLKIEYPPNPVFHDVFSQQKQ